MSPDTFGKLAEGLIPLGFAIYLGLLSARKIGKPPGASLENDQWHAKYRGTFRVCVVGMSVLALIHLIPAFAALASPDRWSVGSAEQHPNAVGTRWTYRAGTLTLECRVGAHERVGDRMSFRIDRNAGANSAFEHFRFAADGLFQTASSGKLHDPPLPKLKLPWGSPNTWTYASKNGSISYRCIQTPGLSVTVPAGNYTDVVRVEMTGSDSRGERTTVSWYAPKVGLIRQQQGEVVIELESFQPAP